jgi:hypothetical protein
MALLDSNFSMDADLPKIYSDIICTKNERPITGGYDL